MYRSDKCQDKPYMFYFDVFDIQCQFKVLSLSCACVRVHLCVCVRAGGRAGVRVFVRAGGRACQRASVYAGVGWCIKG